MDNQSFNTTETAQNPLNLSMTSPVTPNNKQISKEPHISPLVIIMLLFIFQPLALYFMYREKRYHRWFAFLLWFYSVIQLVIYCFQAILIYPQLSKLYENLTVPRPTANIYAWIIALTLLSFIEIIAGVILLRRTKEPTASYKKLLLIIVGILILGFFFGVVASVYSFVFPIYTLTNSIK